MIKFLAFVTLAVFGTTILLYAVIMHEPPAFFAFVFGILTGACWAGILGLWCLRQAVEGTDDD